AALAVTGRSGSALRGQSRVCRAALGAARAADLRAPIAPAILLPATAAAGDTDARAGGVQVIGVDDRFWHLGGTRPLLSGGDEQAALNQRLATRLGVRAGGEVILRVEKPGRLSR